MRLIIFSFVLLATTGTKAQTTTKFYDSDWMETAREKATYVSEFTKVETGYKCLSYWKNTKKKREESLYVDTSMTKPNGLQKVYHKNGNIEDSLFFDSQGKLSEAFHFYANGQKECIAIAAENGTMGVREAYDEIGIKIKNYVYTRSAEPKGGVKGWQQYLQKNASKELTSDNENSKTVKVQIRFVVDQEGYVIKAQLLESSGIKAVNQDALRLVLGSPQWTPAIYKNKPFRLPVTLPMTYVLQGKKSKIAASFYRLVYIQN